MKPSAAINGNQNGISHRGHRVHGDYESDELTEFSVTSESSVAKLPFAFGEHDDGDR
jgi:hypothetical protein